MSITTIPISSLKAPFISFFPWSLLKSKAWCQHSIFFSLLFYSDIKTNVSDYKNLNIIAAKSKSES
jgi:hypothetical protein